MAGILQCFPTDFQKQAFIGVDAGGFGRRDVEEQRVELIDTRQEPAPFAVGTAGDPWFCIEPRSLIPSVLWYFRNQVPIGAQVVPERFQSIGTGITSCDPNDCDAVTCGQSGPRGCWLTVFHRLRFKSVGITERQVSRGFSQRLMFEEQGLGQTGKPLLQHCVHLGDEDRINSVLFQRPIGVDPFLWHGCRVCKQGPQVVDRAIDRRCVRFGWDCRFRHPRPRVQQRVDRVGIARQYKHGPGCSADESVEHSQRLIGFEASDSGRGGSSVLFRFVDDQAAFAPIGPADRNRSARAGTGLHVSIKKAVRGAIVGLAGIPKGAGQRGEADEEVEVLTHRCTIQGQRAQQFWGQHEFEILGRLVQQETIPGDPGRVDDPMQSTEPGLCKCDGGFDSGILRDVGGKVDSVPTRCADLGD